MAAAFLLAYLAKSLAELKVQRLELAALASRRGVDMALAKDQLKATLDAIPDLVWLKDTEGVYLSCNPQFERYAGASEADILDGLTTISRIRSRRKLFGRTTVRPWRPTSPVPTKSG